MIRVIYNLTTKQVSVVMWAEGETLFNQALNGMIQGDIETVLNQSASMGIDTVPIVDFLNAEGVDTTLMQEQLKVERDIAFGRKLKIMFLSEQKTMDIPFETDMQILQALSPIIMLLDIGAIIQAHRAWQEVPINEIITQERKDKYNALLTEYLNL